ncbi:MAG: hypothetical protein VX951_01140 [Planctomycetota bacterium]|nr:hypothetical protein [Planctomycetota bacterium]
MHRIQVSPHWLLLGAAAALCQCNTGPAPARKLTVQPGSRVAISYVQQGGTSLTMVNTSSLSKLAAKAAIAQDPSLKVVPDEELQRVLDVFGGYRFFDFASSGQRGTSPNQLIVMSGTDKLLLTSRNPVAEATAAFGHSLSLFLIAYNANDSYTGRKITAEELKAAGDRLNRGAGKKP